jgi:CubicO group peptidase (beta-lactamase class C family)
MNTRKILIWLVPVVVLAVLAVVLIPRLRGPEQVSTPAYWPTQGWRSSTPEEQGIDSAKLAEALLTMREQNINIHSLLVIRNGAVLVDAYFYPYDGKTVHELASVTKSVMTTLIAIAADQGKLQLDQPMVSFFPGRTIANRDARKERITVRHLASMSSGLDSVGRERDEGTLKEMWASTDWVQFSLDRRVAWEPGTHFVYDSPGMHLLSAILQQTTGITALEFARQNLFKPLGIQEAIWPTDDPQGYNNGSAYIYLHPRDAAKIGYLWLNKGQWEDKQIVSRDWVENSVKAQIQVEGDDDYGYGWWVTRANGVYTAAGRGGQFIKVVPFLNVIVVTTGGGFDYDEIDPLLTATLVDPNKPLPANPAGVAMLKAALRTIVQPPNAKPVPPLPETAKAISGKTFVFGPNPIEAEAIGLEFGDSAEAVLHITPTGGKPESWPIGLDGVYRMSPGKYNFPQGLRGSWADAKTFVFEYDNIANNDHAIIRIRFEGNRVEVESRETAHELGVRFEGKLKNP